MYCHIYIIYLYYVCVHAVGQRGIIYSSAAVIFIYASLYSRRRVRFIDQDDNVNRCILFTL